MKVLIVSCMMAVALIDQIETTGYETKPYPSYTSNPSPTQYSTHSSDESSEEQSGEAYSFGYHVKDDPSYNLFGQQEKSDGQEVLGSYYVNLPDGRHQTVNYKAGGVDGYVADVNYENIVKYPSTATKYKRQVKYNRDTASYPAVPTIPSTLYYPTQPSYPTVRSYPRYKVEPQYNHQAPSHLKAY